MKKILLLLVATLLLSSLGCARNNPRSDSWEIDNVPFEVMQLMADETGSIVATDYPPGHTQIFVVPASTRSVNGFAPYLENTFRNKGFSVLSAAAAESVNVLYRLDSLKNEEAAWYLNIQFNGRSLTRCFNLAGPEGLLSQTTLPETQKTLFEKTQAGGNAQARHFKDGVNDVTYSLTGSDLFD